MWGLFGRRDVPMLLWSIFPDNDLLTLPPWQMSQSSHWPTADSASLTLVMLPWG